MSRCIAINKNNNICRTKLKDNQLFCCSSHYPYNRDIVEIGCFICTEKIDKQSDLMYLKCKHAFHKPCYEEWLKFSTYDTPICLICRNNIKPVNEELIHFKKKYKNIGNEDMEKIFKIKELLENYYKN